MSSDSFLFPEMYLPNRSYNHNEERGKILYEDDFVWRTVDSSWYPQDLQTLLTRLSRQRPTIDKLMELSSSVSTASDCCRAKMGCVVTYTDLELRTTGFNHKPEGMPHSCIDAGCRPASSCRITIHAEVDAFKNIFRDEKEDTIGNIVINRGAPCLDCAKLCLARNVKAFIYREARPQQNIDRGWLSALSRIGNMIFLRYV